MATWEQEKRAEPKMPETVPPVITGEEAKRFAETLNRELSRESREGLPSVSVEIFFSMHKTAKDIEGLGERLESPDTDAYAPELFGWAPETLKTLRELAAGAMTPEEALEKLHVSPEHVFYAAQRQIMELIAKTGKPIVLVDAPNSHEISERYYNEIVRQPETVVEGFEGEIERQMKHVKTFSEIQKERNEYIAEQLKPENLVKLLDAFPELTKKKHINVLLSLGTSHTPLYYALKKRGAETTRTIQPTPFTFFYGAELERRVYMHKEVTSDLVAKSLFENWIWDEFEPSFGTLGLDSSRSGLALRALVSRFTYGEIENIYKESVESQRFSDVFRRKLVEKNLFIPQNDGELDRLIKSRNVDDQKGTG